MTYPECLTDPVRTDYWFCCDDYLAAVCPVAWAHDEDDLSRFATTMDMLLLDLAQRNTSLEACQDRIQDKVWILGRYLGLTFGELNPIRVAYQELCSLAATIENYHDKYERLNLAEQTFWRRVWDATHPAQVPVVF